MTRPTTKSQTNRLLGYPDDARLLILNADDFGMCHAVNEAVFRAFGAGLLCSATLMVPGPWALHAMRFLAEHPGTTFGVHLTVVSEWTDYRWGPLTPKEKVPSLVDATGNFRRFDDVHKVLAQVRLGELEVEFRAQIEAVLDAGLEPTHLDWHALRIGGRTDIEALMLKLAREYRLALRVVGESWTTLVQSRGLPCNDHRFLDCYLLNPADKHARYQQHLRELPAGLSEWAVHPGLDTPELRALDPGGTDVRYTDFSFLTSQTAKDIIEEEGIILLDYRALQTVWNSV